MFIPERPGGAAFRTLIVLLDGTGDSIDDDITNIAHLKDMLFGEYTYNDKQMVLYLRGIGSPMDGYDPSFDDEGAHPWKSWGRRTWEQAFATSFGDHVIRPYKWLAQNYKEDDKICIFGFSRGAYTARVLAGMINAVGLIPENNADLKGAKAAYDLYDDYADLPRAWEAPNEEREAQWLKLQTRFEDFKIKEQSREVFIEFLGCWDTVNSVGYVRAIKLGFTRTNDIVRTFRHAISLDEHRAKFTQNNWSGPPPIIPNPADRPKEKIPRVITDVEEVWFAGCHCDVGGGSVPNGTRPNLAHIPLRWMVRECFKAKTGIIFYEESLRLIGMDPTSLYPEVKPRPQITSLQSSSTGIISIVQPQTWGAYLRRWSPFSSQASKIKTLQIPPHTEEELDVLDALAPAYDQLVLKPRVWAAMEKLPLRKDKLGEDGVWCEVKEQHLSRGRTIPPIDVQHGGKIKVHYTVRLRMESQFGSGPQKGEKYLPLARIGYAENYEDKIMFDQGVASSMVEWVDDTYAS